MGNQQSRIQACAQSNKSQEAATEFGEILILKIKKNFYLLKFISIYYNKDVEEDKYHECSLENTDFY